MEVIIESDYNNMSKRAALIIAGEVKRKPDLVLGLATGSTPVGTYKELIKLHKEEGLDFSKVTTFNLDEYIGLSPLNEQSYNYFMWSNLFNHININRANVHIPLGNVDDPDEHCSWYEERIRQAGGIDLQLLGIGGDGHIAFNEPGSSMASRTRIKALDQQTITDNSRFFEREEEVPRFAITMGIGTILEAEKILLIANGKKKADVCAKFIEGPITSQITSSALQLHKHAVVVLDEDAASKLERKVYYNRVRDQKLIIEKKTGR
ncbi:MAG: glucosamine-6-phosphate deaminase [Spirochaetota bacterium]|nr:MAG: glucosamine-6-phosphate deaminase [Spirochaetota bacterium]